MKFYRDNNDGPACLEYSWVPQGLRHHILLRDGQAEGFENDTIPNDIKPSHVQVYVLSVNNRLSLENWQFPDGPPHDTPVVLATVDVNMGQSEAVGTVYYADGLTATSRLPLDLKSRECPQKKS
jgi:hypothetical protein